MRLQKTITPLIWRMIVFLCLFIIISGMVGPRIISGGILFRDGFAVYGGVGKAMIFGLIAFALLVRHNKSSVRLQPWHPILGGWLFVSFVCFVLAWVGINNLLADQRGFQNLASAHAGLLVSIASLAVGCIGPKNIQLLWHNYRREIISSIAFASLFYLFLFAVYALWRPLASFVLLSVKGLLDLTGIHAVVVPPHTLLFDKFGITVAQYCSGIESIALFTGLYSVVGLLDWQRLHKKRYFIVFPFGLLVLYLLNILRVYGLIIAGYYINPQIAFSLFHTYAGMVFFVLYSAAFWAIAYKYLIKHRQKDSYI